MSKKKINGYNVMHVDKDTGEILCETTGCTEIIDNSKTESEKKRLEYIESHVMSFNKGEKFVKLYDETIKILRKNLTPSEFMVAISLAEYTSYEDCIIKQGGHGNGHDMNMNDLAEELGIEYTRISKIIKSLIQKGVIGRFETGNTYDNKLRKVYIANPYIYFRGNNVNKSVANYFSNSGWKELLG